MFVAMLSKYLRMKTKRNVNHIEIQPLVLEILTQIDMELDEAKGEMEKENLRKEYDDWMELATLSFSVYENDGKYGVKLSDGRIAEPAVYDEVRIGAPEVIVLAHKGDEWIVLYEYLHRTDAHIRCKDLKPTEWAGVYMAQVAGLWGLYDTNKNDWILPPDYNEIICNGWNTVLRKGDKYGFFGYEFYVPAVYDGLRFCRDWGYVGFYKGDVLGYIDKDGRWTDDISKACVWAESAEHRIWPKKETC